LDGVKTSHLASIRILINSKNGKACNQNKDGAFNGIPLYIYRLVQGLNSNNLQH
jgi:hypothetical protein